MYEFVITTMANIYQEFIVGQVLRKWIYTHADLRFYRASYHNHPHYAN